MTATLQSAACLSPSSAVLESVRRDDCNLAIWQRPALDGIQPLLRSQPMDVRFDADLSSIEASLREELESCSYPRSPSLDALVADIAILARMYCGILSLDQLEIRLEIVTTDSCRKFHADYVNGRLITTYAGAGTQWLDACDAERVRQGLEPREINQLAAGDVGIFKGRLATEEPAIHRSPPIGGTGEKRLLLVLNPSQNG